MAFLDFSKNWNFFLLPTPPPPPHPHPNPTPPDIPLVLFEPKENWLSPAHFGTEVGQGHFLPFLAIQFHSLYSLIYLHVFYALLKKTRFLMLHDLGII